MDKIIIKGGKKLTGHVRVSCAKNAYLPLMAAVLLSDKKICFKNLPELADIRTMNKLLEKLGVHTNSDENKTCYDCTKISKYEATYDLVKTMRASILVLGPLLARFKQAKVSLPGGCAIGTRPIDIHLSNLEKMGAEITIEGGYVSAKTDGLIGADLTLSFPSVGATENIMMAAVYANGPTTIRNAAREPEIRDLGDFLNLLGAKVEGAGSSIVTITPATSINEVVYEAIPDRIEACTYIIAGLITNSEITVENVIPHDIDAVCSTLKEMGANLEIGQRSIKVLPSLLKGVSVDTEPHPGFPTDVQAQIMALCTQAQGTSIISEKIFENRFMHVPELHRMNAKIILKGHTAIVEGKGSLSGAPVMCTDLRASAALVLAALAAEGETEIRRVYHLDRGYEKLDQKLQGLGADIVRVKE
ncbi:MAG: UDP-N-acetylglucosamine 1-carboxyvinyltransferase [Halobacteriovoraceae bacterium]|nr:UDP-N-acetylglucosamine 1-carboxyvinyltransferase [Halobacteriovoraceae bacterium]